MKKILLLILLITAVFASCKKSTTSFLDPQNIGLQETDVFTDSVRTIGFLNGVYANVNFAFRKDRWSSHGNTDIATDDAEYRYAGIGQFAVILYNGSVNPANVIFGTTTDFYIEPYLQIRAVNVFLAHINAAPLSQPLKTRLTAEARYLRAYYYHYLVKTFGGVILVGDKVFGKDDIIDIPRSSFADCVSYIVSECDEAAKTLPIDQNSSDFGRATKGACMALKARMLLTAASPLFNGGGIVTTGPAAALVGYTTYDAARWTKAAQAAKDVIDMGKYTIVLNNTPTPGLGFYSTFLDRNSPEIIFEYTQAPNRDFEGQYNSPSRSGAYNTQPTQNLVDAFPMINGKPITDPTSGYDPNNPYVNRDPRFAYSITYNGANYANNSSSQAPVYTYVGAPTDGFGVGTTTGYYARKMCDVNISYGNNGTTPRGYALIRYAEILLAYAEAENEIGQTTESVTYLRMIRERAGITKGTSNFWGVPDVISQSDLRDLIRNERRIEMAFEDNRFYDIRRWKIGEATQNGYNNVMKVTPKVATVINQLGTSYTYVIQPSVRKHVFFPANYLMPIPLSEILKVPSMVQNPGY